MIKQWISLHVVARPVRSMPRERCEHAAGCHMCPRSECIGSFTDPHDPDLTKPRRQSSGHCIYVDTPGGWQRWRVSREQANAHYAKRAAAEQAHLPPHLWKAPGYDVSEIPSFLKQQKD